MSSIGIHADLTCAIQVPFHQRERGISSDYWGPGPRGWTSRGPFGGCAGAGTTMPGTGTPVGTRGDPLGVAGRVVASAGSPKPGGNGTYGCGRGEPGVSS